MKRNKKGIIISLFLVALFMSMSSYNMKENTDENNNTHITFKLCKSIEVDGEIEESNLFCNLPPAR